MQNQLTFPACNNIKILCIADPAGFSSHCKQLLDGCVLQVEGRSSVVETFRQLLREEGGWGLTKGLSARIVSSLPTSLLVVLGYETLKRLSLRDELIHNRHW